MQLPWGFDMHWLPRSLVWRVFTLYTVTLVFFSALSLALFYRYQFELALEDTQLSALMLTEVTAQTITDSAIIGDYETIARTLKKVISRSTFSSAAYIDMNGGVLHAQDDPEGQVLAPRWLKEQIVAHLTDVNHNINVGGRDYGVLRLRFDVDQVAGKLWVMTSSAILLALAALVGGMLLIWFPLRKWLGTLDMALQARHQRGTAQEAPDTEKLILGMPLEFRPMVLALSQTAHSLRAELDQRERAMTSLREVLSELKVSPLMSDRFDHADVAELSTIVAQLVTERETSRTAIENARDAAEAANRAKSEFLANMSHEIRTPMNAILGMAQVLDSQELSRDQQKESTAIILRSGRALLGLLNDILDLSKIEAGKVTLKQEPCHPADLVRDTMQLFAESAREKSLALRASPAHLPSIRYVIDAGRLQQMLSNLIGNAIKFTDVGGIDVSVRETDRDGDRATLEFSVNDTGIGIPADKLDILFESFTQVESSPRRHYGGTGLGLSIVRKFAGLMGGEAGVQSTWGVGSRFWFRVAATPVDPPQVATDSAPAERPLVDAPAPRFKARVLIAEDNAINVRLLQLVLTSLGIDVVVARNGLQAAETAISDRSLDLILMDVSMPELDGMAATRRIRQWEESEGLARCPIVAVTANAFDDDRLQCRAAGMDGFLAKPVIIAELKSALDKWLPHKKAAPATTPLQPRPADPAAVVALIQEMLPLIEKHMFDGVSQFRILREKLGGSALEAQANAISHRLEALDFDGAALLLREIVASHQCVGTQDQATQ